MTPASIDRVFGTSRLKMVTGQYVDVYREAAAPGERRRYTKRFLNTKEGDFSEWTEREWRILARLVGHGAHHVPDVVQYDRGAGGGEARVQTYDAGVTLDHWVTLLQVQRDGRWQRHIFRDCAHWWALARHLLLALHEIHALQLVHLDLKADNICLPLLPTRFDPLQADGPIHPVFEDIALIDFAFSLISGEALTKPLPIGWQRRFPYQSPRLLQALVAGHKGDLEPTRQLDWRCDMYSLAALLNCLLPGLQELHDAEQKQGWNGERHAAAQVLLLKIRETHDREPERVLPHLSLAADCAGQLQAADLAESLRQGWTLWVGPHVDEDAMAPTAPLTPVTLIEPPASAGAPVTEIYVPAPHLQLLSADGQPDLDAVGSDAAAGPLAAQGETGPEDSIPAVETPVAIQPRPETVEQASVTPMAPPRRLPSPPPPLQAGARRRSNRAALMALPVVLGLATAGWWLVGTKEGDPADAPPTRADRGDSGEVVVSNRAGDSVGATAETARAAEAVPPGPAKAAESAAPPTEPATPGSAPRTTTASTTPTPSETSGTSGTPATTASRTPREAAPPAAAGRNEPAQSSSSPSSPSALAETAPPTPSPRAPSVVAQTAPGNDPGASDGAPPTMPPGDDRYAARAREIVTEVLPGVVARASPQVAQVLSSAAQARDSSDDRRALQAAASIGDRAFAAAAGLSQGGTNVAQARQLNAAAQAAFWQRGDPARAFELQWQAFGAHPQDPEIAGNLAFYALKVNPRRVEMARNLAIYSLAAATRSAGASRLEDWGNLAVASALSGRPTDASGAMLVMLAVSRDVNRSCRSALSSVAAFGPALQAPAEAVLTRVNERGSAASAPSCQWPPRWMAGSTGPGSTVPR